MHIFLKHLLLLEKFSSQNAHGTHTQSSISSTHMGQTDTRMHKIKNKIVKFFLKI